MPMQRAGETEQNLIRFKNQLRRAQSMLEELGPGGADSDAVLDPLERLAKDGAFWQSPSRGLAVFASPGFFRAYRVPLDWDDLVVAAHRFHVKPLLPLLTDDGPFHVLAVSQNRARLLRCTRQEAQEMHPEGMPRSLSEALKYDDPQRQLQFHTGAKPAAGKRPAMYHGHGVGIDENKDNILRYFRQIDRALGGALQGEKAPFVLAGVDYLFPLYREANTFAAILEEGIAGNPDALTIPQLHREAWKIAGAHFARGRREAAEKYRELAGTGLTSRGLEPALLAAKTGRVASLFVARDVQQWGRFDDESHELNLHQKQEAGDEDLLDLTAVETLMHGGTVYAVESEAIPDDSPLACVLRY
jgi:hypothetical protein